MTTQRPWIVGSNLIKKKKIRDAAGMTKTMMLGLGRRERRERSVWWRRAVKWHERSVPRESEGGRTPIGTDASYRSMKHTAEDALPSPPYLTSPLAISSPEVINEVSIFDRETEVST